MVDALKSTIHSTNVLDVVASTTQTQGQAALVADNNIVITVANANDVVTLQKVSLASKQLIINLGANILQVFPALGDDLGNGINASTTVPAGDTLELFGITETEWTILQKAGGVTVDAWSTVFKTADETKNNDNVLANDADLQFTVEANKTYAFRMYIIMIAATNPDFAYSFSGPAGATADWINSGSYHPTNARGTNSLGDKTNLQTNNIIQTTPVYGRINIGGTAGTFAFQWAQNSSNGANTTLLKGSWMEFKKLD